MTHPHLYIPHYIINNSPSVQGDVALQHFIFYPNSFNSIISFKVAPGFPMSSSELQDEPLEFIPAAKYVCISTDSLEGYTLVVQSHLE